MSGKLFGIGVGPGDPELLTIKAHRILKSCKVVSYPAPDDGESFARAIVAEHMDHVETEIPIVIPMRVERFPAQAVYDQAAEEISTQLRNGNDVAVLCEGDPFFYGSFMYLFERMDSEFEIEIVPGVSSLMASASALKRPLAARNDKLVVLPGPLPDEQIISGLQNNEAIAIIKVGRHFERLRKLIEQEGLLSSAGYLERVSLENQKVIALSQVDAKAAPYFSIILIYKGAEDWIASLKVPHNEV